MYSYKAYVTKVYDGDTITCTIDLGFGVLLKDRKIRLANIDAPELRGISNHKGILSRDFLRDKILGKEIVIKTEKDKTGKYGRYIGEIYLKGQNINKLLVKEKLALEKFYK